MLGKVSPERAGCNKPHYCFHMNENLMVEPVLLVALLFLTSFLLWLLADSDDDNSGGGLHQPVLIPIPVRQQQR